MNNARPEPEAVSPDPPRRAVDTFNESAWIGLIAFEMQRVRVPAIPALGSTSTLPETNVRTYIIDPRGRRGVWFLSLDVPRLVPALVARATYGLPYSWSTMTINRDGDGEGATRRYQSRRRGAPRPIRFKPGG